MTAKTLRYLGELVDLERQLNQIYYSFAKPWPRMPLHGSHVVLAGEAWEDIMDIAEDRSVVDAVLEGIR